MEGTTMRDNINTDATDEDVEGHVVHPKANDDDVEGHVVHPKAADDDDVEGHGITRPQ
jgi:hypothetical protein